MSSEPLDLRLVPSALTAWCLTATGLGWPPGRAVVVALMLLAAGVLVVRWAGSSPDRGSRGWVLAATLVVASGALAVSGLRAGAVQAGPVPDLALDGAQVEVDGVVTSDPVRREGDFDDYVLLRLSTRVVTGRGVVSTVRSPLLVIGDVSWQTLRLGERITATGRLSPAGDPDLAAVFLGDAEPVVERSAGWVYSGVGQVRGGIREAAAPLAPAERALIPALVDGDDSELPPEVTTAFQTAGLTHLLAVSGTNLTLVLAFALLVARWCGVTGRGLVLVGLGAVVFFVLLARPEPSVLRAAAMGVVGLAGLSAGGRRRGIRALCVAVTVLLLMDPWLARSVGFLLSTLATGGIVCLAPAWRDALAHWLPGPVAEAVAVPLAAQIVCTPVVAAVSGQVSIVAVVSNLLVAPAVGPATVLGLVAGIVAVGFEPLGHLLGWVAGVPAWWIVTVAVRSARLDGASVAWPVGAGAVGGLTVLCLLLVVVLGSILRRRLLSVALMVAMVAALVRPVGRIGWPPDDWLMVMCDVGQGDALVLNAGRGVAVVVDSGPDPALVDECLDELDVTAVALVVLTHFHADHVDGLSGVGSGRSVAEVEVSPLPEPADRALMVATWAAAADIPVTVAVAGERRRVGELSWEVLAPASAAGSGAGSDPGEADGANNASIVMRVEAGGHTFLLSGDAEPEEEADVLRSGDDIGADVFKVAHHGSANQDPDFVLGTGALVALVSVGVDNDYGHPAAETLALLSQLGAQVYRTDLDGDIAVVERAGQLAVVTSGPRPASPG